MLLLGMDSDALVRDNVSIARCFPTVELENIDDSSIWNPALMLALLAQEHEGGSSG